MHICKRSPIIPHRNEDKATARTLTGSCTDVASGTLGRYETSIRYERPISNLDNITSSSESVAQPCCAIQGQSSAEGKCLPALIASFYGLALDIKISRESVYNSRTGEPAGGMLTTAA